MFQWAISTSRKSYTHRYAIDLKSKWEKLFRENIPMIDWAYGLTSNAPWIEIGPNHQSEFEWNKQSYKIIYAFHPQHQQIDLKNSYLNESILATYTCGLIAGGCPNPPPFGRWGLHLSALEGLRILDDCGLLRVQVDPSSPRSPRPFFPHRTFLWANFITHLNMGETGGWPVLEINDLSYHDIQFIHLIKGKTLIYDSQEKLIIRRPALSGEQKLLSLLGTEIMELVAFSKNRSNIYFGIHPSLSIFPTPTLSALRQILLEREHS